MHWLSVPSTSVAVPELISEVPCWLSESDQIREGTVSLTPRIGLSLTCSEAGSAVSVSKRGTCTESAAD